MDVKLLNQLQKLEDEIISYQTSHELRVDERAQFEKIIRNMHIGAERLAITELSLKPRRYLSEQLSEAMATLKSSQSLEIAYKALSLAYNALNFVLAQVVPDEPWPRK